MSLRPRARIHLSHIADNWRSLKNIQKSGLVAAVVKADAYGHGLGPVAETLHEAGCDHFFTAHCFEAQLVREKLGPHAEIYCLNGPAPDEQAIYRDAALTPVINSAEQYQTLCTWLTQNGKLPRNYALHFDTGMNRLGLEPQDAAKLAEATASHPPKLIMSHLACAEDTGSDMNAHQMSAVQAVSGHFPGLPVSLANSAGLWLDPDYKQALSRPGLALYGGGHAPEGIRLKPGLTLEAPILQIRKVRRGETVGYGASWTAPADRWMATVAIGYGDGLPRSLSNRGFVSLGGQRCAIRGRVSMDLITIEIDQPSHLARPGIYVQVIGQEAPLEEQAARAGTLGYELITGLTPRVTRIYENL